MRRCLVLMGLLALLVIGRHDVSGEDKPKSVGADLVVGTPIQHGNLTIFPLTSRVAKNENPYITLDEGLRAGSVKVMEIGAAEATAHVNAANPPPVNAPAGNSTSRPDHQDDGSRVETEQIATGGADVNHLLVLNRSKKPLYLMPGEITIGGEQDRVIGREYIIEVGDKPVEIEVFCVEHGRWEGRGESETAALVVGAGPAPLAASNSFAGGVTDAHALAAKADKGEFIGSVGNVSKPARVAVQDTKNQEKVWEKVAEINAKSANGSRSGGFAGNYAEPATVKQLEPYVKALQKTVAQQSQIVGVVVAIDGKMDTLDVFESTPLFRQLWPKLLKSYALDAANAVDDAEAVRAEVKPGGKAVTATSKPCTVDDARRFLAEALSGKGQQTDVGGVSLTSASTEHLITFSAQDSRRSREPQSFGGAGGFGGGFGGGAVHASGFAK